MGVIYILTNRAFKNLVKIGYADDLNKRVAQLNSSDALPYPFEIYAYYTVPSRLTDLKLHSLIDKLNPSLRTRSIVNGRARVREFFELSPADAYSILEAIAEISDTTDHLHKYSSAILKEENPKKQRINTKEESTTINNSIAMQCDDGVFKFCSNRLNAYMKIENGKYVLQKGAELGDERASMQNSLRILRKELLNSGKIVLTNGKLVLDENIEFKSSSAAAKFVAGSSVDGLKYWIDINGRKLEDLKNNN